MGILSGHPVTIALAIVSMIVWTIGNYQKEKKFVYIGISLSLAALVTLFLGY